MQQKDLGKQPFDVKTVASDPDRSVVFGRSIIGIPSRDKGISSITNAKLFIAETAVLSRPVIVLPAVRCRLVLLRCILM